MYQQTYSDTSTPYPHSSTFNPPPSGSASEIELVPHHGSPYGSNPELKTQSFNRSHQLYGINTPKAGTFSAFSVALFLVPAAGVAVAHHIFYSRLHGTPVDTFPSMWAIRIGTAAAFLFKTIIALTIGTAYVQRIWVSMRNKMFSIAALNSMFSAETSPKNALLQSEMWTSAKVALLLALLGAALPLVPILTPATLTIVSDTNSILSGCSVPSGDIKNPAFATQLALMDGSGFYARPAPLLQQAVIQALAGKPVTWTSPCGANCTYELQLPSLYLNCTDSSQEPLQPLLQQTELYVALTRDLITTDTNEAVSPLEVEWSTKNSPGFGDKRVYCIPRKTTYTIQVTYENGRQNNTVKGHTIDSSVFGRPGPGTPGVAAGEPDRMMMTAMLDAVYNVVVGSLVNTAGSGKTIDVLTLSPFIQVTGTTQRSYKFGDLEAGLEKLMIDTSLSLFALADGFSPPLLASSTCQQSNSVLKFSYQPFILLVTYAAALAIGVVAALIAVQSLLGPNQRQLKETSFSAIMASTRNESIETLLNDSNMTEEKLKLVKLRYGRLSNGRDAFGVREDFR